MKKTVTGLILLSIFIFTMSGCVNNTLMLQQLTSYNVGCDTEEVVISKEHAELNGTQVWIAKCGGKAYTCDYLDESSTNCYELTE